MTSPFLETKPHLLCAGDLSTELRESIQNWFALRGQMPNSATILKALADLTAEQIAANPTGVDQVAVFNRFIDATVTATNAAVRRRMGGIRCAIVKQ